MLKMIVDLKLKLEWASCVFVVLVLGSGSDQSGERPRLKGVPATWQVW